MFTFANYSRRFPINTTLTRYCSESTNNYIRKLTQERNRFLIKKYSNHDDDDDDDDDDINNKSTVIISIASILSAFYFIHKFIYSK